MGFENENAFANETWGAYDHTKGPKSKEEALLAEIQKLSALKKFDEAIAKVQEIPDIIQRDGQCAQMFSGFKQIGDFERAIKVAKLMSDKESCLTYLRSLALEQFTKGLKDESRKTLEEMDKIKGLNENKGESEV